MTDHATELVTAIVTALPGFLRDRVASLGAEPDELSQSITEAVDDADRRLRSLVGLPFDQQARTPLEVVRVAVQPLSEHLAGRGFEPPGPEGPGTTDDPYGLAPVSAAELGEAALEASLAWGLAKTTALTRPLLLVVSSNLMDASRFEGAARAAGYRLEFRRDTAASTTPLVAFVDLEHDGADEAIRVLAADRVRVVAYGPHVDDQAMVRAVALGATAAEPRSRMFRNPAEHLPPLV